MGRPEHGEEEPLVSQSSFQLQGPVLSVNRPTRDLWAGVTFLAFLVLTFAGGIYAYTARSSQFTVALNSAAMRDPASCPAAHQRGLLEQKNDHLDLAPYQTASGLLLLGSTLASFVGGFGFLLAFKHQPYLLVVGTVAFQVTLPVAIGLVFISLGLGWPGAVWLAVAALIFWAFYRWRGHLRLCARLLGVSANGLYDNPGLLVACALALGATIFLLAPILVSFGLASMNGQIVPSGAAVARTATECRDMKGRPVSCCTWSFDAWVPAYAAFNLMTMFWAACLMGELRRFVLSATIAHWYFAAPGTSLQGSTRHAVKLALGPSFGTCSFGAAVLAIVQAIRNMAERGRRGNSSNLLVCLLAWALECCLQFIEFLTRFAIVRAAITGEAFLDAGRSAAALFERNFLKTFAVWWIPPLVLRSAAFIVSIAWGLAAFLVAWLLWQGDHPHDGWKVAIMLGVAAMVLSCVVHAFFAGILLNAVDAVYMCYTMDKDTQAVTKGEVHDIMDQLPVGVAVQNPDGNLNYGAPSAPSDVTYVAPAELAPRQNEMTSPGTAGPPAV